MFDFETDAGEADMPIGGDADAQPDPEEIEAGVEPALRPRPSPPRTSSRTSGPRPTSAPTRRASPTTSRPSTYGPRTPTRRTCSPASPDFIDEEAEEDEDLWFEKGPPKDFDFEDEK